MSRLDEMKEQLSLWKELVELDRFREVALNVDDLGEIEYLFQCVEESRKWHKMYEDFSSQDEDTKDRLNKQIYDIQLQNQRYKQGLKFIAHTAEIGLTYQWHAEAFKEKAWEALKEDEGND